MAAILGATTRKLLTCALFPRFMAVQRAAEHPLPAVHEAQHLRGELGANQAAWLTRGGREEAAHAIGESFRDLCGLKGEQAADVLLPARAENL